jgi:hypothetical protein
MSWFSTRPYARGAPTARGRCAVARCGTEVVQAVPHRATRCASAIPVMCLTFDALPFRHRRSGRSPEAGPGGGRATRQSHMETDQPSDAPLYNPPRQMCLLRRRTPSGVTERGGRCAAALLSEREAGGHGQTRRPYPRLVSPCAPQWSEAGQASDLRRILQGKSPHEFRDSLALQSRTTGTPRMSRPLSLTMCSIRRFLNQLVDP